MVGFERLVSRLGGVSRSVRRLSDVLLVLSTVCALVFVYTVATAPSSSVVLVDVLPSKGQRSYARVFSAGRLVSAVVPVSVRPRAARVPLAALGLEPLVPETGDVAQVLGVPLAITVDGPHAGPDGVSPVWLRGWRSGRFESVVFVLQAADDVSASSVAAELAQDGAFVLGSDDKAPRPWTLPAADEMFVTATPSAAVIVARVGSLVVSSTVVASGVVSASPVPVAAAVVAKVVRRFPSKAPSRPSGRQMALVPSMVPVELLPSWVLRAPTRGWVAPVLQRPEVCVAFAATSAPGWSLADCGPPAVR